MKVAYLIDRKSVGGGCEYIRQLCHGMPKNETKTFLAVEMRCRANVVNAWRPDIIHVNHLKALLQLFANPFRRPCAPVVFTVHGIHLRKYDFLPRTFANRLKRFLRLELERRLYARCKSLIALTPTDAQYLRDEYRIRGPIHVIGNGVEVVPVEESRPLRYREDEFMFISIARFNFPKGQDILLQAIADRQDALRALGRKTLFIGGGDTWEDMRRFSDEQGIGDLVEFAGEIPNASHCLDCGKVLVAPSRWEGLPLLILEAAARCKLVIASDCPGNRDVVLDGKSGLLFSTGDVACLADILVKDNLMNVADDYGRELEKAVRTNFSIAKMLRLTEDVYGRCKNESEGR